MYTTVVRGTLEVLIEGGISRQPDAVDFLDEANQLTAIFAASSITARRRANLKSI
jgi:hypothetical protein